MDDVSIPRAPAGGPASAVGGPASISPSYAHSYRTRRSGMDTATRRLVMAASGLALVLVAGMGVWTFTGHRSAGIPVIEADSRPLRVRPDNPGGMTVLGAGEGALGSRGDGPGDASDLAPEAERPDPQALRAQRQAAVAAAPAAPTVAPSADPAPPSSPPAAAAPSAASAPPPASAPVPAPKAVAPATATAPAPAAGGIAVQLAAVDTEAAAPAEWQRLARKAPELLGERKPAVSRTERDGKVFWRIRTGGFADMAGATEFCRKLRARGLECSIAG